MSFLSIERLESRRLFCTDFLTAPAPIPAPIPAATLAASLAEPAPAPADVISTLPVISVNAQAGRASENGTARAFTLVRSGGDTSSPLRISFLIGGKATNGVDYTFIKSSATIGAGKTTVRVYVTPIDDAIVEAVEAVTLTLSPRGIYHVHDDASANTIRISDNDGDDSEGGGGGTSTPIDTRTSIAWTKVASSPIWRCESQKGIVGEKMYVFGGFVEGMTGPVTRSDVYDPAANTWTQIADLPTRLTHGATAVDGTKIYIAGGWEGWGVLGQQDYGTRKVWIYDTVTNTYAEGPSLPEPRGAGVMVKLDRTLHFMGGTDPQRNDRTEHWTLDLDDQAAGWKTSIPVPVGRNHVSAAVVDGHIFFIGGQTGADDLTGAQDSFYVFHPAWTSWRQLPDLPLARSHANEATLYYRGRILLFGGTTNGKQDLTSVTAYDPATGQWTALTSLPAGRYTGLAAIFDDTIYYATGGASTTYRGVFA